VKHIANQIFVIAVLLALMLGVDRLKADAEMPGDPLTLAAIGFVLLVAFTVAELGARLSLPKVTGFIVAGIALGPHAGNVLSHDVVVEMKMFNDLALGLIAMSAGLELDGKGILRRWRAFSATVAFKVLLLPLTVGGTFYALQTAFGVLPLETQGEVIGMAAVFTAFAVATSPSISVAVLTETRAKGILSDLTLGMAVLKDVVVVVCLAVAIAIAKSLTAPDATLGAHVFYEVGVHLGEEALIGLALAIFLALYIRFVGAEMLLFVAAMILVLTQLTEAVHLQPVLVFIVAGFVVRNFTPYEHRLLHPLQVVSLPVFVVFFTNAGASVDLGATARILPFVLALGVMRAITFYVAGRFGAAIGGVERRVQDVAWMAYLPLAGVTLGFVGIAAGQLPEFAPVILNAGMAFVAVNLLVGPITLRLALNMTGEIPAARTVETDAERSSEKYEPPTLPDRPELADRELRSELEHVEHLVAAPIDAFVQDVLVSWSHRFSDAIDQALPEATADHAIVDEETVHRLIDVVRHAHEGSDASEHAESLQALFEGIRTDLNELPLEREASLERRHKCGQRGDSIVLRIRKRLFAVTSFVTRRRTRVIPLRMGCRLAIEPCLSAGLLRVLDDWCRTEAAVLAELRQLAEGHRGPAEIRKGVAVLLAEWVPRSRGALEHAVREGLVGAAEILVDGGTPALPTSSVRFSLVEPVVTRELADLGRLGRRWEPALQAAANTLDVMARAELLERRTLRLVESGFLEPMGVLLDSIQPEVIATRDRLREARERVASMRHLDGDELGAIATTCRKAFPQEAHVRIKKMRAGFKDVVSEQRLARDLHALVEDVPEKLTILRGSGSLDHLVSPGAVEFVDVPLREISDEALIVDLLPVVDERVREANALVTVVNSQLREHVSVAVFAVDAALDSEDEDERGPLVSDGLERAIRRIDELATTLERVREDTPRQVEEGLANALTTIREGVTRARAARTRRSRLEMARRRVARVSSQVRSAFAGLRQSVVQWGRQLRDSDLTQDLQARSSKAQLDAAGLHDLLYPSVLSDDQVGLPPIYGRLFTLDPLHDRRFFAAYRNELRTLVREEQAGLEGRSDGVLIVGEHGSGRTSMLNVAQLEFRAPRIIFLGQEQAEAGGFMSVLAAELQCEPATGEIRSALAEERTTILVDDLEQWFVPDPKGIGAVEPILDLILTTRHVAFWAVTTSKDALALLDPIFAVRQVFGRLIMLGTLDDEALARVIETRNKVSGLDIEYPHRRFAGLYGERHPDARRSAYYRGLTRATRGNLRAALHVWHRDVRAGLGDVVHPRPPAVQWSMHQRLLNSLHVHALGILVQATRLGVLDANQLSSTLGLSRGEVSRHLAFLRTAGILERRTGLAGGLRVAPTVQPTITRALLEAGALRRWD
jgi:Kef-type K+ transport system membrane component KefB